MVATSNTIALASSVLGFDIVELWSHDAKGKAVCAFIHASGELVARFPDIIAGPYPTRKDAVHVISPKVWQREDSIYFHFRIYIL
jgi:hypothetical protein